MRNRSTLTVLLLGLLFGISGAAYFKQKERAHRSPASTEAKSRIPWVPAPVGKHLALIKVEIAKPEVIPDAGDDEVVIHGRVLVTQNLASDLSYTWHLPDEVQVVSGIISDSLANVKMGQVVDLSITVKGFTKEHQRLISLQASANRGELVLGGSAVLASRPEDTWEAVAPDMKKSADEQLGPSENHARR
jgi:hypothetical protein